MTEGWLDQSHPWTEMSHFLFGADCSFGKWQPCPFWGGLRSSPPTTQQLFLADSRSYWQHEQQSKTATQTGAQSDNAVDFVNNELVQSVYMWWWEWWGVFSNNKFSTKSLVKVPQE